MSCGWGKARLFCNSRAGFGGEIDMIRLGNGGGPSIFEGYNCVFIGELFDSVSHVV